MSVPKKRLSKRRIRARRSHHALSDTAVTSCASCGAHIAPHRACNKCGSYKGEKLVSSAAKTEEILKKAAPAKEAEEAKK